MKIQLQEGEHYTYQLNNPAGASVKIHATEQMSGHTDGFRPMEMLLCGIAACSAIDMRLIMDKQRQHIDKLTIEVEGLRNAKETPSTFNHIILHYQLSGTLDAKKTKKAVELALYKYCSVQKHLATEAKIDYLLTINGNTV